jgi:peptidyl-prolyl cis-trans isomerase D
MLTILRKRAQSTAIQFLVLAIAVVFIFWGVGTNLSNKRNSVATVNNTEISFTAYQRSYERAVDNFSQQFGGSIPKGLLDNIGMKNQVLNQMIQTELLRQGGRKMGLSTSQLSTREKIKTMPVFQENGIFSMKRYEEILSQNRTNPSSFEADLQSDLLTQRVSSVINDFSMVTDSAVQALIDYGEEKIKLDYVVLNSDDFLDKITVEDQALTEWYKGMQDNYKSEPTIRIKYLFFKYDDDIDQVVLENGVASAQYDNEKDLYETPEKRRARHILFKVTDQNDERLKKEVKEKAAKVLALAKKGEDFAALAQEYSEDQTKTKGGDLGFFGRGQMVKSFDEAVFSMTEGQISELVESPFGYHVIKLETIKPMMTRSFESVENEITTRLKKEKAVGYTFQRASTAYEDIIRAGSIDKYEAEKKAPVVQSDYFPRNSPPPSISTDIQLKENLLSLNKGELSSLIKLDNGYSIVFIDDVKEPEVPKLEDIRQRVEKDYKKEKAVEMTAKAAETLLKDALAKNKLSEAATVLNLKATQSEFIKRSAMQSNANPPAQVAQDAFQLPGSQTLPKEAITIGEKYYIYQIIDRQQKSAEISEEQRKQAEQQLLSEIQNRNLSNWLSHLERNSKIWTNQNLLQ